MESSEVKFPETRDKKNTRLTQYLFTEHRERLAEGIPNDPRTYADVGMLIAELSARRAVILTEKDPQVGYLVADWASAAFACTFEKIAIAISYTKLLDEIRKSSDVPSRCERAPALFLLYPELGVQTAWARGKVLDIVVRKKNILVITGDVTGMGDVLGEAVMTAINGFELGG